MVFDFVVRQKLGGNNVTFFMVKQLPFLKVNDPDKLFLIHLELTYTSWDIKAFADELWEETEEKQRAAIQKQWEENQKATGGHEWKIPNWHEAYPEIAWEKDKGCPLPPFKWDEDRRVLLKAELDARFALLYGLERDELRYILDPQDVYGKDFPGETFRVLKDREMRTFGEYRTRRLVLEAYDRLRPEWDMEGHLELLKEEWEKCQVDLSEQGANTPSSRKAEVRNAVEEQPSQYGLFGNSNSSENH